MDEGRRFVCGVIGIKPSPFPLSPFFQLNFHPSSFTFHLMVVAAVSFLWLLWLLLVLMVAAAVSFLWLFWFVVVLVAAAVFAFVFLAEVESQGVKQQACQQNGATDIEPRCFLCRAACL